MNKCPYCDTEYSDERDKNGQSYCDCVGARLERAEERIVELKATIAAHEADSPLLAATEKVKELEAELATLREAQRWIPVGERLPLPAQKRDGYCSDSSDLVHVYPPPSNDRAVVYMHYLEKWSCSAEVNVTHWRPLPQPPQEVD